MEPETAAIPAEIIEPIESTEPKDVDLFAQETPTEEPIKADAEVKKVDVKKNDKIEITQKRVDELTRLRRTAERERDYLREQIAKVEKPADPDPVKTLADFEYNDGKYQAYFLEMAKNGATNAAKQVIRDDQAREYQKRKMSEFESREDGFAGTVEDYAKVARNNDLRINPSMAEVITDMDDGPAVLYYLGKNPDIAEQISAMSPLSAARELGKIEVKVKIGNGPNISNAPAPPPKLKANNAVTQKSSEDMDYDEFALHRRGIISKRRK